MRSWDCFRLKIEKRRKAGKKGIAWQRSGMKSKIGGNLGTKKDGRMLFASGGHAKCT